MQRGVFKAVVGFIKDLKKIILGQEGFASGKDERRGGRLFPLEEQEKLLHGL